LAALIEHHEGAAAKLVDGRPAERSYVKKRNNFLEQVRKAQEAAKTKPQTGASKSATEMIDSELRAPSSEPAA
jgi:hypothetical protein